MTWHLRYGSWWMIQWMWLGWISLGIHIDFCSHANTDGTLRYGPYVDFHLGLVVVSIGRNPLYAGMLRNQSSIGIPRAE